MLKIKKWIPLFTTQFFGVLNDNVLKNAIIFISIFWLAKEEQGMVIPIASALLVLPFVLFSPLAGRWSQTKSKQKIFELAKLVEIPIMLIAVFGFFVESIVIVMVAMLLMGVQSALYSPSKYGLIRDVGGVEGVSFGIGTMELLTFVGVLIGQVATGFISDIPSGSVLYVSILMLVLAVAGWISSKKINAVEPMPTTSIKDTVNPVKYIYQSYSWSKSTKGLNYTIFGLGSFWLVASMLQMNIYLHAPGYYGMSNTQTSVVMALIAIGIGTGCWVAGLIAKDRVEIGLVPIGGIALSICLTIFATFDLSPTSFVILLFIAAFFSGFYKVPLNAWIQQRVAGRKLGNILAYNNMVAFLFILISAGIFGLVTSYFDTSAVFLVIAMISWIMTIITLLNIPSMMIKFIAGSLAKFYFKIDVIGKKHVPEKTGGLLIANHQSLIDPFIISAAIPRMVRFVMAKEIYENPLIHWLVKRLNVIPVSAKLGKDQLEEFTNKCQDEINKGHLVCIFPEGQISRIGHLLEFRKGVEHIAEGIDAPIIPLYLDGIHGIPLSFDVGSSKPILKVRSFKKHISVNIGEAIHHRQSAFHLRQRIEELRSEAFVRRIDEAHTLGHFFSKMAKGNTTTAFLDAEGEKVSYADLWRKSSDLRRYLNIQFNGVQTIGVISTQNADLYLLNISLALAGIEVININPKTAQWEKDTIPARCDFVIVDSKYAHKLDGDLRKYLLADILSHTAINTKASANKQSIVKQVEKHDFVMSSNEQNEKNQDIEIRLTNQNILASTKGLMQIFKVKMGKKILSTIPFHSAYGYSLNIWLPLLTGMTIVNPRDLDKLENLARTIISEKVDILFANNQIVEMLFDIDKPEIWNSIETIVTGRDAVNQKVYEELNQRFGTTILQSVSFTEYSTVIAVNSPNYDLKDIAGKSIMQVGSKANTFGRPIPGIAIKIVDPIDMNIDLGADQKGTIMLKGASLSNTLNGSSNNEISWINSGFEGAIDQDGFLAIEQS